MQEIQRSSSTSRLLRVSLASLVFFIAIVFWPAGTIAWTAGWLHVAVVTTGMLTGFIYLRRANPAVIEHRLRLHRGTKYWDWIWFALFTPAFLAIYTVSGLDAVRFEWSTMSLWLWPLGLVLWLSGYALLTWAMGVNPFFEKTVRIQAERGHRVIDTGPYRFVRHPGYLGFFGWILSAPLFLGSWWAFLPALLSIACVVIRTTLEDRTLHRELGGYQEYASRVRYRLVPGVW